ncbi:hypothetical protein [Francisella philomiragia]|uniref:Uncharacterized protein n=1 Tax=Francisella philomiragia TaxID=28110 RepID=A0A0B6D3X7_9GAMM|nr:hypothetical protein [Francisella philomiragia]AJI53581.1 hypothetical protein LA55_2083 [Francisella philomiragia]
MSIKMISITTNKSEILIACKHIVAIKPSEDDTTLIVTTNEIYETPMPYIEFIKKYPNTIKVSKS